MDGCKDGHKDDVWITKHWVISSTYCRGNNIGEDQEKLSYCRFPKYTGLSDETYNSMAYCIVGFCDASKYASKDALHQRTSKGCRSYLVFSKVRLAPTKNISIPQLQLLVALTRTRSIQFIAKQLRSDLTKTHLWTDLCVS